MCGTVSHSCGRHTTNHNGTRPGDDGIGRSRAGKHITHLCGRLSTHHYCWVHPVAVPGLLHAAQCQLSSGIHAYLLLLLLMAFLKNFYSTIINSGSPYFLLHSLHPHSKFRPLHRLLPWFAHHLSNQHCCLLPISYPMQLLS
jgi:hypothetical protein